MVDVLRMMRLRMSLTILWLALGNGGSRSGQRTPHHFTQTHGHSTYYLYLCRRTAKIVVYFIYVGRNKNVHFTSIFVLMLWFMLVAHWFHALAISSLFIFTAVSPYVQVDFFLLMRQARAQQWLLITTTRHSIHICFSSDLTALFSQISWKKKKNNVIIIMPRYYTPRVQVSNSVWLHRIL